MSSVFGRVDCLREENLVWVAESARRYSEDIVSCGEAAEGVELLGCGEDDTDVCSATVERS